MNFSDDELVTHLLQEIAENKIKTKEELNQEIKVNLYRIYKDYLKFEKNQDNFRETYTKLENTYKYVELEEIEEGRFIRYISPKYFFDIELKRGGFVAEIDLEKRKLKVLNGNKVFYLKCSDNYSFFMKLNDEDKVKQRILESLD